MLVGGGGILAMALEKGKPALGESHPGDYLIVHFRFHATGLSRGTYFQPSIMEGARVPPRTFEMTPVISCEAECVWNAKMSVKVVLWRNAV